MFSVVGIMWGKQFYKQNLNVFSKVKDVLINEKNTFAGKNMFLWNACFHS